MAKGKFVKPTVLSKFLFVILILFHSLPAQQKADFNRYFQDQTLRIDYFHTGDAEQDQISIDALYRYPGWAGNPQQLIDPFNNGHYYVEVYDRASNHLIFSRGFNSYFAEYQTTEPARKGVTAVFHESVLIPFPKSHIRVQFRVRDDYNILQPVFGFDVDPEDISIIQEKPQPPDTVLAVLHGGDPRDCVDLLFLSEGYRADELAKFKADLDSMAAFLFRKEPFAAYRQRFNISGVFRESAESGVDEPRKRVYRNTVLNASFNALGLQRYLLTRDNRAMRDMAAAVPYDALVILVNSDRYGGGGIYNQYAISTAGNQRSRDVFVHEFGHAFAGLGDEYYAAEVAYQDFYKKGVEPTEPNITALLNPELLKWRNLLSPGIDLPTDWGKAQHDTLQAQLGRLYREKGKHLRELKEKGASEKKIERETKRWDKKIGELRERNRRFFTEHPLREKVGAFEGAGYSAQGLYRPMLDCLMFSGRTEQFCRVCQAGIERMIRYYAPGDQD